MLSKNTTNALWSMPSALNCSLMRPTSNPTHVETTATLTTGEVDAIDTVAAK